MPFSRIVVERNGFAYAARRRAGLGEGDGIVDLVRCPRDHQADRGGRCQAAVRLDEDALTDGVRDAERGRAAGVATTPANSIRRQNDAVAGWFRDLRRSWCRGHR